MTASASVIILFVSAIFWTTYVSCSKPISYALHCASLVPELTPRNPESTIIPFPSNQDGFYHGGDGIFSDHRNSTSRYGYSSSSGRKTLLFQTHHVYTTARDDVYKVHASLMIDPSGMDYYDEDDGYTRYAYISEESGTLRFEVGGFWSKSTGKLCMVGSSTSKSPEGKPRLLLAVLKLYDVWSSNNITSLVKGTLDSLSLADESTYFHPVTLLMFPRMNYKYTKGSKDSVDRCNGEIDVPNRELLSLPLSKPICSVFSRRISSFELNNAHGCSSTKNCSPFGEEALPKVMSLRSIQCSNDRQSLRFLVDFPNTTSYVDYYMPFDPKTTLVAEGSWDAEKKQLCAVACRISNAATSFNSSHVEDCSTRLSFKFPSVWSIKESHSILGHIWSTKKNPDPGYFPEITFHNLRHEVLGIPGLKYDFTMIGKANGHCFKEKMSSTKTKNQYPDANSYDMQFSMSVKNSSGKLIGWGSSEPIFAGNQPWNPYQTYSRHGRVEGETGSNNRINISYTMTLPPFNSSEDQFAYSYWDAAVKISAEGIYDVGTGQLCMVGCRHLDRKIGPSPAASMDCELLVTLQFPPLDSSKRIKGKIVSLRQKSDSLYFESLTFSATSFSKSYGMESIWRMDLEIVMSLVSNTLLCFFVVIQILHLMKHQAVFPFISIAMLVVLAMGQMIPLVLNFGALFFSEQNNQTYLQRSGGGWIEVNEVLVRVITMVAFLLQIRLLQLVWSSRSGKGNENETWIAEKKTLYAILPLYIAGGLIVLMVNWKNYRFVDHQTYYYPTTSHSLLSDLRSYAGLILDGFLIPQILLNILLNSKELALSRFFYLGITFVRLLPHTYDLYRARYYDNDLDWSYSYANPGADYYSTAWDVLIPLGGLLFAAVLFLQQRFGGRFFLPRRRLQELKGYEKVPVVSEEA